MIMIFSKLAVQLLCQEICSTRSQRPGSAHETNSDEDTYRSCCSVCLQEFGSRKYVRALPQCEYLFPICRSCNVIMRCTCEITRAVKKNSPDVLWIPDFGGQPPMAVRAATRARTVESTTKRSPAR